jgi:membrane-associated two-gene conflict system component 1 (EACC1)
MCSYRRRAISEMILGMSVDSPDGDRIELAAASPDDFDELYAELRGVSGLTVTAVPVVTEPGEQGSIIDLLTVACSGGALTVFLEIIRSLVRSRGPGFELKVRRGKDRLEITAENADEVLPLIAKMLDGS